LVQQLGPEEKKFLKEHIETKRIKIEHRGIETDVARRIIKVKRRGGVGSGFGGAASTNSSAGASLGGQSQ
jgi:hypothetical protein